MLKILRLWPALVGLIGLIIVSCVCYKCKRMYENDRQMAFSNIRIINDEEVGNKDNSISMMALDFNTIVNGVKIII